VVRGPRARPAGLVGLCALVAEPWARGDAPSTTSTSMEKNFCSDFAYKMSSGALVAPAEIPWAPRAPGVQRRAFGAAFRVRLRKQGGSKAERRRRSGRVVQGKGRRPRMSMQWKTSDAAGPSSSTTAWSGSSGSSMMAMSPSPDVLHASFASTTSSTESSSVSISPFGRSGRMPGGAAVGAIPRL